MIKLELTPAEYEDLCAVLASASVVIGGMLGHSPDAKEKARIMAGLKEIDGLRATIGADKHYTCEACKGTTQARLWGPGWITCPLCKGQARTVHEKAQAALLRQHGAFQVDALTNGD